MARKKYELSEAERKEIRSLIVKGEKMKDISSRLNIPVQAISDVRQDIIREEEAEIIALIREGLSMSELVDRGFSYRKVKRLGQQIGIQFRRKSEALYFVIAELLKNTQPEVQIAASAAVSRQYVSQIKERCIRHGILSR